MTTLQFTFKMLNDMHSELIKWLYNKLKLEICSLVIVVNNLNLSHVWNCNVILKLKKLAAIIILRLFFQTF